ncbi:MAG: DASS family sodium-coupled anion symporter [Acidobacteria bacterium]|nr:DASS family sodium-coupled anion symporter [Acidobacteriota bacterium]
MPPTLIAPAGTALWRRVAVLIPGALLYFLPLPGLQAEQSHLLAVFVATIISLVAQPVPMGVSVLVATAALALTRTVPAGRVLSGFSNPTTWMIWSAFLFARAVIATGFGPRIAYLLIHSFGRSAISLAYCLSAATVTLAAFIPSDTGRGGGIVYPITRSLAKAFGSEPGPTAGRFGAFLMLAGFHANYIASAVFLTSMAANPLIADFAFKIAHVELTWLRWALASSAPALLSFAAAPWVIQRICPPEVRDTTAARTLAGDELRALGPVGRKEARLVGILLAVMAGWVTSPWHGVQNAYVALGGLSAILLCGVMSWEDLLGERRAWDAFLWFGPVLMMADQLLESGVVGVLSKAAFGHLTGWPWGAALAALVVGYLYIHYAFASMTAHATALYPGFLTAALASGVPPFLAALPLAYFSNLNAGISHYGTGSAPVFFGPGYVGQGTWWKVGFLMSLVNLAAWLGVGPLWWKLLGLW